MIKRNIHLRVLEGKRPEVARPDASSLKVLGGGGWTRADGDPGRGNCTSVRHGQYGNRPHATPGNADDLPLRVAARPALIVGSLPRRRSTRHRGHGIICGATADTPRAYPVSRSCWGRVAPRQSPAREGASAAAEGPWSLWCSPSSWLRLVAACSLQVPELPLRRETTSWSPPWFAIAPAAANPGSPPSRPAPVRSREHTW
jgi:hypothetical protein